MAGERPSSFFGMEPGPDPSGKSSDSSSSHNHNNSIYASQYDVTEGPSQAARIAAYHRNEIAAANAAAAAGANAGSSSSSSDNNPVNNGGNDPNGAGAPSSFSAAQAYAALPTSTTDNLDTNALSSQTSTNILSATAANNMSSSASNMGGLGATGATRPASIAPTVSGALLDHSHLRPGQQAALLSHNKTLELYRQNAKKTNDPNLIYEFAVFMIDASKSMGGSGGEEANGSGVSGPGAAAAPVPTGTTPVQSKEDSAKDELVREAIGLLKKIAERGHPDAQYFLADCYANGIGTAKGKQDFDRAYPLFVLAAKHGHPDAAYRAATCYEKGWGCRKDGSKALQFYRKASSQSHPGAQYRLATAELNGELGLKKSAKEGVKWLKRSAEAATPEFPHALHELALLHERGVENVLFVDQEYACELLAQAGEMGYAPSAYKLGVNYEYGKMGCPVDGGLSIHMYNIAAQQNHKEACFALTAWYLVGAPGILPQSDTEAYLWAKKAAEQGLAKAEYAVGYFKEMGIGTVKDLQEARAWYRAAGEHGDKRANQRLAAIGPGQAPGSGPTNYQAQEAATNYQPAPTNGQNQQQQQQQPQQPQQQYQQPHQQFQRPPGMQSPPLQQHQQQFQRPPGMQSPPLQQHQQQQPPMSPPNTYQPRPAPYQSYSQNQGLSSPPPPAPAANYSRPSQAAPAYPAPPQPNRQSSASSYLPHPLPQAPFQQQPPYSSYNAAQASANYQR